MHSRCGMRESSCFEDSDGERGLNRDNGVALSSRPREVAMAGGGGSRFVLAASLGLACVGLVVLPACDEGAGTPEASSKGSMGTDRGGNRPGLTSARAGLRHFVQRGRRRPRGQGSMARGRAGASSDRPPRGAGVGGAVRCGYAGAARPGIAFAFSSGTTSTVPLSTTLRACLLGSAARAHAGAPGRARQPCPGHGRVSRGPVA